MKQAWTVGIVMAYFFIFGLNMMIMKYSSPDSSFIWNAIPLPSYTSAVESGSLSSVIMNANVIMNILFSIGGMALLYFPAIFSGVYLWAWVIICLPVAIGFWMAVATIVRGSSST